MVHIDPDKSNAKFKRCVFSSNEWLALISTVFVIKIIYLLLDPNVMFFMGDSGAYLYTAETGWVPPDRSYIYGMILMPIIGLSQNLTSVIIFQTIIGTISSVIFALLILKNISQNKYLVYMAAILFSLDPFQLTYERFLLTETISAFFFVVFLFLCCEITKNKGLLWVIPLSITLAVLCVMTRTAYFPAIVVTYITGTSILILKHYLKNIQNSNISKYLPTLAVITSVPILIISLNLGKSEQSRHDGYFWISSVSPLVTEKDFIKSGLKISILEKSRADCGSDINSREKHRWIKGCLVSLIHQELGNHETAVLKAKEIAKETIYKQPLQYLQLGVLTYLNFWDNKVIHTSLKRDTGIGRKLTEKFNNELRDKYNLDYSDYHTKETVSRIYLLNSTIWVKILLITPFLLLISTLLSAKNNKPIIILLFLCCSAYIATISLFVTDNVVRYLHPLGIFAISSIIILIESANIKLRKIEQ
ncbi:hypothetical protein [Sessilibacter sp. MAH2]